MNVLRRTSWRAGMPVRAVLIAGIKVYRATLSGWLGGQCRFYPTCSHYAEDVIRSRGALAGSAFAVWRLLRCNPFGAGGPDPAPAALDRDGSGLPLYDAVTHAPFYGARS